jgi:sugar phosphate isomerase/epimerase
MYFGTTTMVFYSRPLEEAIAAVARCGYDYAELWMEQVMRDYPDDPAAGVGAVLNKYGMKATVHCPVMDVNITSPNIGIREESIRQYLSCFEFARGIGARLVVVHPGHRFSVKEPFEEHWTAQVDALKRVFARGAELGITLAIENMEADKAVSSVTDYADMERVMADCDVPDMLITLDTTHMRDTGRVVRFIEKMGQRIAHVHLSDATATSLHLRMGLGTMDFAPIANALKAVGFAGVCSLETFIAGSEDDLIEERQKLVKLFG